MSIFGEGIDFPSLQKGSDDDTVKTEEDNSDSTVEAVEGTGGNLSSNVGAPSKPERHDSIEQDDAAKYGYEEATPMQSHRRKNYEYDASVLPRRSSMKSESCDSKARRESIGSTSTQTIEVRVRGERFPVERRRSIEFYPKAKVETVTRVTDLASEEDLWVQEHEMAVMKEQRRESVRKLKRMQKTNVPAEKHEEDFRGLEKYVDKTGRGRKMEGWDAVLWEQEQQELYGNFDDEKIAELYRKTTGPSPQKAADIAKQDAADIESYLMTPRTTKLMMRRSSM